MVNNINSLGSKHKTTSSYKAFFDLLTNISTSIQNFNQAASNPQGTIDDFFEPYVTQD